MNKGMWVWFGPLTHLYRPIIEWCRLIGMRTCANIGSYLNHFPRVYDPNMFAVWVGQVICCNSSEFEFVTMKELQLFHQPTQDYMER